MSSDAFSPASCRSPRTQTPKDQPSEDESHAYTESEHLHYRVTMTEEINRATSRTISPAVEKHKALQDQTAQSYRDKLQLEDGKIVDLLLVDPLTTLDSQVSKFIRFPLYHLVNHSDRSPKQKQLFKVQIHNFEVSNYVMTDGWTFLAVSELSEINAVLERARAATGKGRSTAIPRAKIVPLLESVLDYIGKGPAEAQGGMHPQATTKDDLDAFAAKILAAVSVQPQVSPTASWARRSYSDALSSGTPQSIPQSALSRMTSTSAAPISSRQAREVRVKTNFSNQQRTRPGHSRTSKEVVNMANAGIDRAGLYQGQPGIYAIEMATVQPSGDYLLLAKDAATAERLIKNGPKWVTSLGGNAEVITPTYGVIAMNIPASTFNPQDQQQMKQMLVGSNPQLLKGHEINHMDWHKKPKPGSDTGSIPYYPEDPAISPGPSERGSERGSVVSFASQEREEVMGDAPTPAEAAAMTSNASQIASSMASQSSRERNPALTSILKNGRTPQRARAKAGKTQLAGISPNVVKKRVFGPPATNPPREERQSEPGSDAIIVVDQANSQRSSPPLPDETTWNVVSSRRSTRSSLSRTQHSTPDDE
ncbi:unnamed protein product [Aureobasidium pullulans]|nr:unnamed protein product [Aureobasidium pullulans]